MKFKEILGMSWQDYKINFNSIFRFTIFFVLIPLVALTAFQLIWIGFDANLLKYSLNPYVEENIGLSGIYFLSFSSILGIVYLFITLFAYSGLTFASLKKKFSFKDLIREGKSHYWGYFGLIIVECIFLFGLTLLLVVPGVIFLVYWSLSAYVYGDEKIGILKSLKRSRQLVRGNWWRVFGYLILIFLIMGAIGLILSLIASPPTAYGAMLNLRGNSSSLGLLVLSSLMDIISRFINRLTITPFLILFLKNLYLELKNEKSIKSKRKKK